MKNQTAPRAGLFRWAGLCGIVLAAICGTPRAEEPPGLGPSAPAVTLRPEDIPQVADWAPHLSDFQNADAAKQQAASKVFIDTGMAGYNLLGTLLKNSNKDVVERATAIRQQIDQRTLKLYQQVSADHERVIHGPLDAKELERVRQNWLALLKYASQQVLRQNCFQTSRELQNKIKEVEHANQVLAESDKALATTPAAGLLRASLQISRAEALKVLNRRADGASAAEDAVKSGGKAARTTPKALRLWIEFLRDGDQAEPALALCQQIVKDHPRSLEVRFAYSAQTQILSGLQKWDDAIASAKAYVAACPLDEEAQDGVYNLLGQLMDEQYDYARVAALAEWILDAFPIDRVQGDAPKYLGGCAEYVAHDLAKAQRGYEVLRDQFGDQVDPKDIEMALKRIQAKKEGTFPKEPGENDTGLAGVFAKFLKAIRARDVKQIVAMVPKDEAENFKDLLENTPEDILPAVTFADFIVKKVTPDEKETTAKLELEVYEASAFTPHPMAQEAVKEDGQWKIKWHSPDEDEAAVQMKPAAETMVPQPQKSPEAPAAPK